MNPDPELSCRGLGEERKGREKREEKQVQSNLLCPGDQTNNNVNPKKTSVLISDGTSKIGARVCGVISGI